MYGMSDKAAYQNNSEADNFARAMKTIVNVSKDAVASNSQQLKGIKTCPECDRAVPDSTIDCPCGHYHWPLFPNDSGQPK